MKTIELFSGTGSFSKVAKELNHSIFRIELNNKQEAELHKSILDIDQIDTYDILWSSPPCTAFSVACIGRNWDKDKQPKSENAFLGIALVEHTIKLIAENKPKYWFIENPRGMLRIVIDKLFIKYNITNYKRDTITYCQYGDTRMKPTDIWNNCYSWKPRPACKNGDSCHISAPRGSRTGTQGLSNAVDRGIIPPELFREIFKHIEINKTIETQQRLR